MTRIRLFSIAANGTPIGIFKATDADAAVLAYAQDAGYKSIEDAASALGETVEEFRAHLDIENVRETYKDILEAIDHFAYTVSDYNEKRLNVLREELVSCATTLEEGGILVGWSADLDRVLAKSHYRDTVYQETAMILSVADIKDLGLLAAA